MAGAKEIRSKIASIKSTQKITSAMEKVAVSKMRRAQMRMVASRPYAERIRQVIGHLANANPEYRHPFMIERAIKRVGYVVLRLISASLAAKVRHSSVTLVATSLLRSATWAKNHRSMI